MSKKTTIEQYREAIKAVLTRVLTKKKQAAILAATNGPKDVSRFFEGETPRFTLFQTRITRSLAAEIRFIRKWTDIAFGLLGASDKNELALLTDADKASSVLTGIRWLIELNLMNLKDKSYYRTDDNWELTHPAEMLFCPSKSDLENPSMWGTDLRQIMAMMRTSHLIRVAKSDPEFARNLLVTDGTWITAKQFRPIAQRTWESGIRYSLLSNENKDPKNVRDELQKEVCYWFAIHREKESPLRERLERMVVLHVEAELAFNAGASISSLVNKIHSKRSAYNLPIESKQRRDKTAKYDEEILEERRSLGISDTDGKQDKDTTSTLRKYAYKGVDKDRAKYLGSLEDHSLGRAYVESAPYNFWPRGKRK